MLVTRIQNSDKIWQPKNLFCSYKESYAFIFVERGKTALKVAIGWFSYLVQQGGL